MCHAVEVVYKQTDVDVLHKYFGNAANPDKGKVTNGQFLAGILEYIKFEEGDVSEIS